MRINESGEDRCPPAIELWKIKPLCGNLRCRAQPGYVAVHDGDGRVADLTKQAISFGLVGHQLSDIAGEEAARNHISLASG